jgi:hypothetical protein
VGESQRFSPQEWRTLQFAPFWVLTAVVGAYRDFDPLEFEAYARCLQNAASAPGRLTRELVATVTADLGELTEQYVAENRTVVSGLCAVASILTRVPTDEAEAFKSMLYFEIGEGLARARGRFGRLMSQEDADNVTLVGTFLSYDSEHVRSAV